MRVAPYATNRQLLAKNINVTWIEQLTDDKLDVDSLGAEHQNYGHLVAMFTARNSHMELFLETKYPAVTPKAIFQTGPRRLLSWCILQATDSRRDFLAALESEYSRLGGDLWVLQDGTSKRTARMLLREG